MSDRRVFRLASTSARLFAGTVVAAGFVVGTVTAVSVPWPELTRAPVAIEAAPAPGPVVAACDGPVLAIGRMAEQALEISVAAPASVTSGAGEASDPAREDVIATPDVPGTDGLPLFVALPDGGERASFAAAQSVSVRDDDIAGFAASACRPPLLESWLVGGSATVGAADLVLLTNPGAVAASVELTVFGATGPQVPPGGTLVIAPRTQRVVALAGLAIGEENPVIRVTATGTPVQAAVQSSITRTLLPGGIEQTGAIAAPARSLVIPGIVAPGPVADGEPTTILRLLSSTVETTATVTVRALGQASATLDPITVALPAGIPAQVTLGPLPAGRYTVIVDAESPVVGAVWQATGFGDDADFAWFTPASDIRVPTLFATPTGPGPRVSLANVSDGDATVRIAGADGSFETEVTIPPQATSDVALPSWGVFLLDPGPSVVRASVTYSGAQALSSFPVAPANAAEQPIVVFP